MILRPTRREALAFGGAAALAFGLPLIQKLAGKVEGRNTLDKSVFIILIASMTVLAVTGFLFGWPFNYPLDGFALLSHVGFGMLYAIALLVYAVLHVRKGGFWFWLLLLSGIPLILSILIAMFPILGTEGQHTAIVVHRTAAIISVFAGIMGFISAKMMNQR